MCIIAVVLAVSVCAGAYRPSSALARLLQQGMRPDLVFCRGAIPVACTLESQWPWGKFQAEYRGQITPTRSREAGSDAVALQGGPFSSRWLRVSQEADVEAVIDAVAQAEDGATSAVYVGIPDEHPQSGALVAALRARGFRFHHFVDGNIGSEFAPAGELIYYRWAGEGPDMVPSYSTALEGVGVIVLSPEKESVLLLWEYGQWKMVTGNVDACESMLDAVRREVHEEVGLELHEEMVMLGGWQEPRIRDKTVNNVFCVFLATAKTRDVKVDGTEITEAQWFPVDSIATLDDERRAATIPKKAFTMAWDLGMPERNFLSRQLARYLEVYREGRGLNVVAASKSDRASNLRDLFM